MLLVGHRASGRVTGSGSRRPDIPRERFGSDLCQSEGLALEHCRLIDVADYGARREIEGLRNA